MNFKLKLITLFLIISLIPYLIVTIYFGYKSENKLIKEIEDSIGVEIKNSTNLIEMELFNIYKDLKFISSLDIMNDIFTNDIDKRITNLLKTKKESLNLEGEIFVIDLKENIIASSDLKNRDIKKPLFKLDINSSISKEKIGYLGLSYKISNLKKYSFTSPQRKVYFNDSISNLNYKKYIIKYQKLKYLNLYLIIEVDKANALKIVDEFKNIFMLLLILGFILIAIFSTYFANIFLRPIIKLSTIAKSITNTKDYSKRVNIKTKDEIELLGNSFNHLLETTELAFEKLKDESNRRLKLFKELIEIFNKLNSAKDKDECREIAKINIDKFIQHEKIEGKEREEFLNSTKEMLKLQIQKFELIEKTKESSKAKSIFIANMSHELRTPLNAIIGFSQILKLECEDATSAENIEISAKHLLEIINDILDMAKLEAKKIKAHITEFELDRVLYEVYIITKNLVEAKGLEYEIDLNTDIELKTDDKFLKQILLNSLSNSIKFTNSGKISLKVQKEADFIKFIIKDSGIGIEEKDLAKLFTPFTQVENPLTNKQKGTGLGLYLSREFAKIIGAEFKIESEGVDKGVVVTLSLKIKN